ncbi:protein Teyrha-meyrha isoform X2 [Bactrocera dorsalis]|uniref:Protein Teyrha-meyrha isoform X2 n=1 Tax=Bactrocera dorsalis TaxID=27457 RepID=A0ABM3JXU3_BACDO|nr:protein Teyrha-meyrha isoform X2 [Bactrocera dorsalis]
MESNAFGSSHLPSQALVVLSEAASGLHEALRGQRPFPPRLPDAKDLHNMSLVGSYGTHLLHSFHPHLLQTLNHGMLAANGGPASYFASDRGLGKPSVLSNFQLPSAFSPPKYIGISLDQNLFNGNDSFRTDSASPTCTSHESMEGSNDYDNGEKGESPRSNNSDPRDLRHVHNSNGGGSSSSSSSGSMVGIKASSATTTATSMAAAAAAVAASVASTTSSPASVSHLGHHHHHTHHHHHHPNGGLLAAASLGGMGGLGIPVSCAGLRSVASGLSGLTTAGGVGVGIGSGGSSSGSNSSGGLASALSLPPGHVPDICPICGIKISAEEWNSHFLTELDRLYKLSSGMERTNLQASYMFAPPCPAQENAIRTSHNRWETFQRIRNNRQNRLRIKGRKRKYGNDLYFMENLFCNSCPICKRKYAIEAGKMPPEEDTKMQEEIETVDVESCNDDVPDSGSELTTHSQLSVNSMSHGHHSNIVNTTLSSNMHSSNSQPGKLDGILYRTACVMNKDTASSEDDLNATSTSGGNITQTWNQTQHHSAPTITAQQGHISVKNVSELSSTTHHFYNADSCGAVDERSSGGAATGGNSNGKGVAMETCNANDSDEDVIVDDDDSIKMTNICSGKKRKFDETEVSSRTSDNHSPMVEQERPRSEPQVTSTEPNIDISNNNNNNNNNNSKYSTFEELRAKQQQQQQVEADNAHSMGGIGGGGGGVGNGASGGNCGAHTNLMATAHTQMDLKTGIKDFATESFFRGRNLYFHQSCANVMSSYRLSKDLQQQQQNLIHQQQQQQQQQQEVRKSPSPQQLVNL